MSRTTIERKVFSFARATEDFEEHLEVMRKAFDEARLQMDEPKYRGAKMNTYEMIHAMLCIDLAEAEYQRAIDTVKEIEILNAVIEKELSSIRNSISTRFNADLINRDRENIRKKFEESGGESFVKETENLNALIPKKISHKIWEAYRIPTIGDYTFQNALQIIFAQHNQKEIEK